MPSPRRKAKLTRPALTAEQELAALASRTADEPLGWPPVDEPDPLDPDDALHAFFLRSALHEERARRHAAALRLMEMAR